MLNIKDKVAIVGCSNAQLKTAKPNIDKLVEVLKSMVSIFENCRIMI